MSMPRMMYDERLVAPIREDLTRVGFTELRTAADVDAAVPNSTGTTLVVVNSVCGCSARMARPAVRHAVEQAKVKPDHLTTVFAGQDAEATERARSYFVGYPPSSPSIALMKDGKLVYFMERWQIESRDAEAISADLVAAFETHCAPRT
ncbi:MAG: BrxA/BrxB family bacilliredoxin [Gemmatimonadetes bacterium]|jgi:putative YphP/YqiW family bacilliredoxin|nr:BrxA/BrxB family bacilliredoxin [Gemmatimonadota bacterium]